MKYPANINDYVILKTLGNVKNRKFNTVHLVENKHNKSKAVLKNFVKSQKSIHLQEFIRKEGNLNFESEFLPKILAFEESETEIKFIKKYSVGIQLDEFWGKIKKKNQMLFLIEFLKKLEPIFEELRIKNLVHCDIKPSNFIIQGNPFNPTKENFEVYLIDFGMAFYPSEHQNRKLIFSLAYSAPEIILNETKLANHTSDLFSLGIMIYQLLNGKLPFSHENPAVLTNLQLTYPIQKSNYIQEELFQIIAKMCFKTSFSKPPHLFSKEKIQEKLIFGINKRYNSLKEINTEIAKIHFRETSFIQKLIEIFSNSKVK